MIGDPAWSGDETLDPRRTLLTEKHQGTFADHVVVPARNALPQAGRAVRAPRRPCMGTAWLTAYRMLFVKSGLRPGQTMLVQGASGGVSTALIQLGRAAGYAGVGHRPHRGEARAGRRRLGAHATFESGERLPGRVDAVFETVGEATWSHSMRALKPGGVIVVSGRDQRAATRRPTCSGCSSSSCASSARPWAPATSSRDLLTFVANSRHRARDRRSSCRWSGPRRASARCSAGDTAGKIVFTRWTVRAADCRCRQSERQRIGSISTYSQ